MGQDKEQLVKLLQFVKELYDHPDNTVFTEGIREMVLEDREFRKQLRTSPEWLSPDPGSLQRIETYLSLDFAIDEKSLPNYLLIKDGSVREKLIADFREMLRCQYGTRNHKIDFAEFCRYAVLQMEMLVNYYFEKKFSGDINGIVAEIRASSPNYTPYPGLENVSEIALKTKLYAVRNAFAWNRSDLAPYINAVDVRNKQSHRSLKVDRDSIRETEERLKSAGAWNEKFGKPSFAKNEDGVTKAAAAIGQDALNEYNFQVWYDNQPFDEVVKSLKVLTEKIADTL